MSNFTTTAQVTILYNNFEIDFFFKLSPHPLGADAF